MAKTVAVIGGGAAGFFTAINIAEKCPQLSVTIYEASDSLLAKVQVSGGGRCNVTNTISKPAELIKNYPRGHDFLKPVFKKFSSVDTVKWFDNRGVPTKIEADGRIFPKSNTSQSIYNCLVRSAQKHGVGIVKKHRLTQLKYAVNSWQLTFNNSEIHADIVCLATSCNNGIFKILKSLHIPTIPPVPSLFTFNASKHTNKDLAGVSVPQATTAIDQIQGSKQCGPLLITHWGYSAPSILKLSAWHARELAQLDYVFSLVINWGSYDAGELKQEMHARINAYPKERIISWKEHGLPKRLWTRLVEHADISEITNWSEIGKKGIKRLIQTLCHCTIPIQGKSIFKEEFVTAGGIDLNCIASKTFAIENHFNLYAAGELLNIDGVTGGFNFQAAWSGAYMISEAVAKDLP